MDLELLLNQANVEIPVDYFVSKKKGKNGSGGIGNLQFLDASSNLVFGVNKVSTPYNRRLLIDASGNLLISLHRNQVSLSRLTSISCFYRFGH